MFQPRTGIRRAGKFCEPERRLEEKEQVVGSRPGEQSGSYEGEGLGMLQDVSAQGE